MVVRKPSLSMHFEVSLVVKVPRAKAYSFFTNFEAMPKWSKDKREVKVVRREGDIVVIERKTGTAAIGAAREMKLFPPERVESEGETRFTLTRSVVRFDEVPEGTRITASLDVEVKGRWSWVLKTQGKTESESSAMDELNSFAKYVEGAPGSTDPV